MSNTNVHHYAIPICVRRLERRGAIAQRQADSARAAAGGELRAVQVPDRVPRQGDGVQGPEQNDRIESGDSVRPKYGVVTRHARIVAGHRPDQCVRRVRAGASRGHLHGRYQSASGGG